MKYTINFPPPPGMPALLLRLEAKDLAAGVRPGRYTQRGWARVDNHTVATVHPDLAVQELGPGLKESPKFQAFAADVRRRRETANQSDVPNLGCDERLYPFQRVAVEALLRGPVLLGDEMGLGKTVVTAQALEMLPIRHGIPDPQVLIIVPASLRGQWGHELVRWTSYTLDDIQMVYKFSDPWQGRPIHILSYHALQHFRPQLTRRKWDVVILDEAHNIKDHRRIRTRVVVGHRKTPGIRARWKWALTGTPFVNRPIEAFPVLQWLCPQGWPVRSFYARRYAAGHFGAYGWDTSGASHLDEWHRRVRAIMVRRKKAEVLPELPPKRRQILRLDAGTANAATIRETWGLAEKMLQRLHLTTGDSNVWESALAKMGRFKGGFGEWATMLRLLGRAKLPAIKEHVTTCLEQTEKVLVFGWHQEVVQELYDHFRQDYGALLLTGKTTGRHRDNIERTFRQPQHRVLIANIKSGGVGLNLQFCSHAVFGELSAVPGDLAQAEDRIHRHGTHQSPLIQYLVQDKSPEVRIMELVVEKVKIFNQAVDGVSQKG